VQSVFGLPAGPLAVALISLLVVATAGIATLAARNKVFFRIGVRNIPRRRGRTALIVVGLMLGTAIIASALLTGDTMSSAVRSSVIRSLGATDLTVMAGERASIEGASIDTAQPYFDESPAVAAVEAASRALPVDGVAAAITEPTAAQHRAAGRTEPRLTLFALDPARAEDFGLEAVTGLSEGEALLNQEAADELAASVGDSIDVLVGTRTASLTVAGIDRYDGIGTDASGVVLPLPAAQALLDREGRINQLLVSNEGGFTTGATRTGVVQPALEQAVAGLGLSVEATKQDGLDTADAMGNAFVQIFTTFGSFSIAAGILLIFLIFVMLASERRPEMGMARAVGTQRRHLVQMFLFEGAVYDVMAAAIGALLGIAVSFVMVQVVARSFAGDVELTYSLSLRSLVIAYGLGALLTLLVVTLSAWRVSRLNIVSAIRDLTEPTTGRRRRATWLAIGIALVPGVLLAVSGASSQTYITWMLGLSLITLAIVPALRLVGASDRVAFTVSGSILVVLWLLPLSFFDRFFGDMAMDFSIWILGGLLLVVAATWVVTFNADVLLRAAAWVSSPFARLRPIVKMAVAYPLRSRFRTGVTMAMFMLVVFTLVTGTVIPSAFTNAFNNVDTFGGGFDVRVATAPAAALDDLRPELPPDVADQITADAAQSYVPMEARQDGTDRSFATYPVRGLDDEFLSTTSYGFAALASGYASPRDVWSAMAADPSLAVVDAFVAPRRQQWGFGPLPEFQLSGFYIDDGTFDPVTVTTRDPLTGEELHLTVIGVLSDDAPFEMAGITASQAALAPFGDRAAPTLHHLALREGADPSAVARDIEAALLSRGAEAESYVDILDDAVGANLLFLRLVQGFMGLGLVVGVAALGVISARAVVERRQQLGMLRAIGFQPESIRWTLLAESSFVSLTSIVVGCTLGLVLSYNVIDDSRQQPGWSDVSFAVPWVNLAVIFGVVLLAALLTTYVPARRASRIYPAEALRYQ
jgi:putative ABC transport system permease protein